VGSGIGGGWGPGACRITGLRAWRWGLGMLGYTTCKRGGGAYMESSLLCAHTPLARPDRPIDRPTCPPDRHAHPTDLPTRPTDPACQAGAMGPILTRKTEQEKQINISISTHLKNMMIAFINLYKSHKMYINQYKPTQIKIDQHKSMYNNRFHINPLTPSARGRSWGLCGA
jgi:hypothetical protein